MHKIQQIMNGTCAWEIGDFNGIVLYFNSRYTSYTLD